MSPVPAFLVPPPPPHASPSPPSHRLPRVVIRAATTAVAALLASQLALAEPTSLPPPACVDCLGVSSDGFLAPCNGALSCVSSQDDTPTAFLEPWEYDGDTDRALRKVKAAIAHRGGTVVQQDARYLRAEFRVRVGWAEVVDEMEVYATVGDDTIQFRSARRGAPKWDAAENRRRVVEVQRECGFTSVPVLRGRARVLGIMESPLDAFGPTTQQDTDDLVEMQNIRTIRRLHPH